MFDIKEELKKLPEKSGVYIMKDENEHIIYVGKAKVLKTEFANIFKIQQTILLKLSVWLNE